jgi:hypothetical protein
LTNLRTGRRTSIAGVPNSTRASNCRDNAIRRDASNYPSLFRDVDAAVWTAGQVKGKEELSGISRSAIAAKWGGSDVASITCTCDRGYFAG